MNFSARLNADGSCNLSRNGKLIATIAGGEAAVNAYVDAYMDGVNANRSRPYGMWSVTFYPAPLKAANV